MISDDRLKEIFGFPTREELNRLRMIADEVRAEALRQAASAASEAPRPAGAPTLETDSFRVGRESAVFAINALGDHWSSKWDYLGHRAVTLRPVTVRLPRIAEPEKPEPTWAERELAELRSAVIDIGHVTLRLCDHLSFGLYERDAANPFLKGISMSITKLARAEPKPETKPPTGCVCCDLGFPRDRRDGDRWVHPVEATVAGRRIAELLCSRKEPS